MAENRILIIRGGAIGDFILTLPVLTALRQTFPDTKLHLLGYPRISELAAWGGLVDELRPIEDRPIAQFFARGAELDPKYQEYFSQFAIVISYLFDPDGIFQENIARCSKAQYIAGPHRPSDLERRHATSVLLEPLQRLAIFDSDPCPTLKPRDSQSKSAQNGKTPHLNHEVGAVHLTRWVAENRPLAIHPGSGSERKNWPENRWRQLLERLVHNTGRNILLVGGEAEGDRLDRLRAGLPNERIELAQRVPLTGLASLLLRCERFLGHDSGITHLAAALGLPTLALWGITSETVWRPLGPHVRVLKSPEGLANLTPDQVLEALNASTESTS